MNVVLLRKLDKIFSILLFFIIPLGLYFAFIYAPVEKTMGLIQKIFYFHISSAWVGFFAFFITFLFSILYLVTKKVEYDDLASASAETGLLFCTIVIVTGPLWARPTWGVYWTWDARLTSTLILWFIYVGYIMLRQFMEENQKRAQFSALLGIIGFINVPIVFLSIQWWENTIHPNVVQKGGGGMHEDMFTAMLMCLFMFTVIYIGLVIRKLRIINIERQINYLEQE